MKYVKTGYSQIPLISLLAMLSISLTVNLPGLAISPIMDKLDQVFKNVTELEVQLLTVLPNLVTIPFILCSGKICNEKNQMTVLGVGLAIYAVTGILYFFARSMTALILLSCLLGVGCGLVIPLAASLISQYFSGKERTKQLGMKSSLSNFMVIFATIFVGWMASYNWHLAFIVYLVPLIPLALMRFMTPGYIVGHEIAMPGQKNVDPANSSPCRIADNSHNTRPLRQVMKFLFSLMGIYLTATFCVEAISYYLPFSMPYYHLSSTKVGIVTALFFLGATLGGFFLTKVVRLLGHASMITGIAVCMAGLFVCGIFHTYFSYICGVSMIGLGYGVVQPIIYDKTSTLAPDCKRLNSYFSYLLACNYVGISLVPFVISGAEHLTHQESNVNFAFIFNGCIMLVMLVIALVKHRSFVFDVDPTGYEEDPKLTTPPAK